MSITPYATDAERRQHDQDGGFTAALALAYQLIAREIKNLPDGLIATPASQQFYATTGTIEQRHAVVDAWAADHHVTAKWDEATGMYTAKVRIGLSSMRASAVPVCEPASPEVPGVDAPVLTGAAA